MRNIDAQNSTTYYEIAEFYGITDLKAACEKVLVFQWLFYMF